MGNYIITKVSGKLGSVVSSGDNEETSGRRGRKRKLNNSYRNQARSRTASLVSSNNTNDDDLNNDDDIVEHEPIRSPNVDNEEIVNTNNNALFTDVNDDGNAVSNNIVGEDNDDEEDNDEDGGNNDEEEDEEEQEEDDEDDDDNISNDTSTNSRRHEGSYEEIRNATTSSDSQINNKALMKSKDSLKIDKRLKTPTKRKMKSTSAYIYNMLYLKGENSDITVKALNKDYKLHKIYLRQSLYFSSMLQGRWKESTQAVIDISIPDSNITQKSLSIAFGSFYKDDIEIAPNDVVSVLATASLFSLDGLLNECAQIMLENINIQTVCYYYEASLTYGVQIVLERCLQWLCLNIMNNNEIKLSEISTHLFQKIISSNDLMVIQVETDLYTLCKRWLYCHMIIRFVNLNEFIPYQHKTWQKSAMELFTKFMRENGVSYLLESPSLQQYVCIFKQIRFQHIITDLSSIKIIFNDRIIPQSWMEPYYCTNWLNTLYIDQHTESTEFEINEADFKRECVRFGRVLSEDSSYTWRWVGFHFGIDLLVSYVNHNFSLKRNITYIQSPYKGLLSNKPIQRIYYIMSAAQLDKYGSVKWFKKTEFTCLDFQRNEDKFVFSIDDNVQFPLIMNLHVACHPVSRATSNLILETANTSTN